MVTSVVKEPLVSVDVGPAISTESREPYLVTAVLFVAPAYTAALSIVILERSVSLVSAASAAAFAISRVAAVAASVRF